MIPYHVRNVNQALWNALHDIGSFGHERNSRNGPVLSFPVPVVTHYTHPTERVLFGRARNANPFFHFFEGLWMLAGRDDVAMPAHYVKRMREYSDDGMTFHGAYGYRWRRWFGYDQLRMVVEELTLRRESRRAVLSMWDPREDVHKAYNGGKDVPCNTTIYFDCRGDKLNMTVCCRSNDMLWGAYGANAVHMTMLQEYVAGMLGVPVGWFSQLSNDLHLYTDVFSREQARLYTRMNWNTDYDYGVVQPYPMFLDAEPKEWEADLFQFSRLYDRDGSPDPESRLGWKTPFFAFVAVPMMRAYEYRRTPEKSREQLELIKASDWRTAAADWLERNVWAPKSVKES
jgi:hypothetical protein